MRYQKYRINFLQNQKKDSKDYESHFSKLEQHEKFITEWDIEDLESYIKKTRSISVNTIRKYKGHIIEIYKYICNCQGIRPIHLYLRKDPEYYLDKEKLLTVTINEEQYYKIRELLILPCENEDCNYRDRVILGLAWNGLTNVEIKHLKKDDIEEYIDYGHKRLKLKIKNNIQIIDDKLLIEDMIKAKKEIIYYLYCSDRGNYTKEYKITEYLIKPSKGRNSKNNYVANPSVMLSDALCRLKKESMGYGLSGIDICSLNIESIRRSKMVYLFIKGYDREYVAQAMRKNKDSADLYWIDRFAEDYKRIITDNYKKY